MERASVAVIIPALDEEAAIPAVLARIPPLVTSIVVVDNGSTDRTADRARAGGARVVTEPRRGYGHACLAGLGAIGAADVVAFVDGDFSQDPGDLPVLVEPIVRGEADLVVGVRNGAGRPLHARAGTALCVRLINWLWGTRYRDLGPFRAIRASALARLGMCDRTWGWTIEMQVKAAEAGLRVLEVPVSSHGRVGRSKISGTLGGSVRAGLRMLSIIAALRLTRSRRLKALREASA